MICFTLYPLWLTLKVWCWSCVLFLSWHCFHKHRKWLLAVVVSLCSAQHFQIACLLIIIIVIIIIIIIIIIINEDLGQNLPVHQAEATGLVQNSKQFALPNTSVSSVQRPCPLWETQMVFPFYISRISPDTSPNFITKTSTVRYTPHPSPPTPLLLRLSTEELGERIDTAPDVPIFLIDSGRWANKPAVHPVSIVTWDLQRLQDIWFFSSFVSDTSGENAEKKTGSSSPWSDWPFCGYLYVFTP